MAHQKTVDFNNRAGRVFDYYVYYIRTELPLWNVLQFSLSLLVFRTSRNLPKYRSFFP
jgi:hypothetical protein